MEAYGALVGLEWQDLLADAELWGDDEEEEVQAAMDAALGACVCLCVSVSGRGRGKRTAVRPIQSSDPRVFLRFPLTAEIEAACAPWEAEGGAVAYTVMMKGYGRVGCNDA